MKRKKNSKLLEVNSFLSQQLSSTSTELFHCKQEINRLKSSLDKLQTSSTAAQNVNEHMKTVLKDSLTSYQIDIITQKNKRVRWTKQEISKFFTLRYFSKRSYKYMACDLNYPLPSLSTLQRYAQKLNLKQGILYDVLTLLKHKTDELPLRDRECVLSFDEMKVHKTLEYDPASDEVIVPYNYMQVVMARGLSKSWKQPVFIGFDQQMTKDILLEIVKSLSAININVVGVVSDYCQSNVGCWKELGAHDYNHPYFKHPCTQCNVYVFPDAPYLLKLIRNWLIDTGFEYNNKVIKSDLLFDLVAQRNDAECTPLHKLTKNHLVMTPQERQNVRRASELISRTTAVSLKRYFPNNNGANELSSFIEKVDIWFSVANSISPIAKLDFKKSYNGNENQKQALHDMFEMIGNMKAIGKKGMQVFQKSILMHITSLQLLFDDMAAKHNIKYISTHKLNQDVLENFFSQLRQMGGVYDHPSGLACLYRIRIMMIGKSPTILQNHTNQRNDTDHNIDEPNEEYLSSAVFSGADVTQTLPDIATMKHLNNICQAIDGKSDDSEIVSTVSSNDIIHPKQESDGLQYVMGYIANKFDGKYPDLNLGSQTFKVTTDHSYCQTPTFIRHLSVGGLFEPSNKFLSVGKKMEKFFLKMNKDGKLSKTKGIVAKLTKIIQKQIPDLPLEIIRSFAKQRIIVRMRYLNLKRVTEKLSKSKRKYPEPHSKRTKKMKKITN